MRIIIETDQLLKSIHIDFAEGQQPTTVLRSLDESRPSQFVEQATTQEVVAPSMEELIQERLLKQSKAAPEEKKPSPIVLQSIPQDREPRIDDDFAGQAF